MTDRENLHSLMAASLALSHTTESTEDTAGKSFAKAFNRQSTQQNPESWSFLLWLTAQWIWSKETFGPGRRTGGVLQHLTKEIEEVRQDPDDLEEWADLIILSLDGFWRHGGTPLKLAEVLQAKQTKNFARDWPDWRNLPEDVAIEHTK